MAAPKDGIYLFDLFSGYGGIPIALSHMGVGIKKAVFVEMDPKKMDALKYVIARRFPDLEDVEFLQKKVQDVDFKQYFQNAGSPDILAFTSSCRTFSNASQNPTSNAALAQKDIYSLDDLYKMNSGQLKQFLANAGVSGETFVESIRALEDLDPKNYFSENVRAPEKYHYAMNRLLEEVRPGTGIHSFDSALTGPWQRPRAYATDMVTGDEFEQLKKDATAAGTLDMWNPNALLQAPSDIENLRDIDWDKYDENGPVTYKHKLPAARHQDSPKTDSTNTKAMIRDNVTNWAPHPVQFEPSEKGAFNIDPETHERGFSPENLKAQGWTDEQIIKLAAQIAQRRRDGTKQNKINPGFVPGQNYDIKAIPRDKFIVGAGQDKQDFEGFSDAQVRANIGDGLNGGTVRLLLGQKYNPKHQGSSIVDKIIGAWYKGGYVA